MKRITTQILRFEFSDLSDCLTEKDDMILTKTIIWLTVTWLCIWLSIYFSFQNISMHQHTLSVFILLLWTHWVLTLLSCERDITWRKHHVRNIKNLNHEKLLLSIMKSIFCQSQKHMKTFYQWSTAVNHVTSHDQLLSFSPVSRFYRSVLHVESKMLRQRHN